jgi:iron complex transport system substrate-binding protein
MMKPKKTTYTQVIKHWITVCMLSVIVAACGGESHKAPVQPTEIIRVVSLAPSITETIFALGQGDKVVGVTEYCKYPPEAQTREIIGGYSTPSLEAIVRCSPDAVVLLKEHQDLRTQLDKLDIEYITVDSLNIDSIREAIETLGEKLNAQAEAKSLLTDLNARIEHIHSLTKDKPRPKVLLSVGRHGGEGIQSLFIAGPGSYFDDLITLAGGTNAYDGTVAYPNISAEGTMQMNPDVIIDIFPDIPPDQRPIIAQDWQSLSEVKAVQTDRVHVLGDDYVAIPGPRFVLVLEQMAKAFHPDVDWSAQ